MLRDRTRFANQRALRIHRADCRRRAHRRFVALASITVVLIIVIAAFVS
jgi:hypothetical protein